MEFLSYAAQLFTPQNLLWLTIGATVGVVLGALPGMSADTGIGIFLPLTFALPPVTALICLGAIYVCASYGGNITAVLVNTPGTSDSLFMVFDGYPMTKKGEGMKAIGTTTISAFIGGVVGCIALLFIAPPLARVATAFGPLELFLTSMMGIIIIIGIVKDRALKGLMSAMLGFLSALIGVDGITGVTRFSFGVAGMYDELPLLPVVLGMFAFSQVLTLIAENSAQIVISDDAVKKSPFLNMKEMKYIGFETLRASVIGTVVGIIPAAGTTVAAGISYTLAQNGDKSDIKFGEGNPKGLAVVSAANNAVVGGSLVPLLTLGIPGNGTAAIFLGGLLIHGLAPGSQLFTTHADSAYGLLFGLLLAQFFILLFGFFGAPLYSRITRVPSNVLIPVIAVLCVLGAYSYRKLAFDMFVALFFGIVGYYMSKANIPMAPFVLAFVLGGQCEISWRRAWMLMKNDFVGYWAHPLPLALLAIDLFMLIWPFLPSKKNKKSETPTV